MPSPFKIVIDGHGDIVGRRVLDCSETAFFSYAALCRATRGAVPRKVIDESLPGHLDAALRREDEPAVQRLAGEAMRRVGRNVRTLAGRLVAMNYPVQDGERDDEGIFHHYMRGESANHPALASLASVPRDIRIPLMLEEFLRHVGTVVFADLEDRTHVTWWRSRHPEVLSSNEPSMFHVLTDEVNSTDAPFSELCRWDVAGVYPYADPLVIDWQSLGENEDGELAMFLSPEDIWKDEEPPVGHMQGNLMALRPYSISLGAPGPRGTAANPAGTNNMLDPLIHFDQEGFPGYPSEFEESAFVRGEDPMRPDIEDVVTRALLRETPDIDAAALRLKVAKYFLGKFFWLQNKPGPFDRGPLTLLQYLRVALHNGGFPGLHGNAAFEPLRRELVEGLEPF